MEEVTQLVQAARRGDGDAWAALVTRFESSLRCIARSYRLGPDDVDEVVQASWLELFTNIQRIREPAALGGWLRTVTRRNAMRRRQSIQREHLTDQELSESDSRGDGDAGCPEASALASERRAALAAALDCLPERHRRLVVILIAQPTLDYRQVGEQLRMPIGSIGPMRARALARLARDERLRATND